MHSRETRLQSVDALFTRHFADGICQKPDTLMHTGHRASAVVFSPSAHCITMSMGASVALVMGHWIDDDIDISS